MAKLTEDERLFRKIEDKIKRAIFDYGLINDGDRILVGLSGGKDSLALVDLLGRRSKIYCPRFEVVVAHIVMTNIPYCSDREYLRSCAEEHDLPFIVHETSFDPSTDTRKSPCFYALGLAGKLCLRSLRPINAMHRLRLGMYHMIYPRHC